MTPLSRGQLENPSVPILHKNSLPNYFGFWQGRNPQEPIPIKLICLRSGTEISCLPDDRAWPAAHQLRLQCFPTKCSPLLRNHVWVNDSMRRHTSQDVVGNPAALPCGKVFGPQISQCHANELSCLPPDRDGHDPFMSRQWQHPAILLPFPFPTMLCLGIMQIHVCENAAF